MKAVEVILDAIEKAGYRPGEDFLIALDPAVSELYDTESGRYVLEIEGPDRRAEEALPAVIAAATVDRATSCFNRLRIVVAIDDPEEMRPRLVRCFNGSAPLDDKVHLHVVTPTVLPFD